MADSRSPSPVTRPRSRTKTCARRCERACCTIATYFPLAFVYSLTAWAVWVDAGIGFHKERPDEHIGYSQKIPSAIGVVLFMLLNTCYTTAVFTDPGTPLNSSSALKRGKYSVLPTSEPSHDVSDVQTITVSSSGSARYCKKCHVSKPDRAHHCSTCKRCVLKMDHHCPWLATCLGLHNYKPFILFLVYTSLFCWAAFFNSARWVYAEIFAQTNHGMEAFAPVNVIMLAVMSGIIGLVLTGFTAWHLYLCAKGQTTIECLEKTRYLSGIRKQVEHNRQERQSHSHDDSLDGRLTTNLKRARDQFLEFHANAVPGASRFEEGEEHISPTPSLKHHDFLPQQQQHHQPSQSQSTTSSSLTASSSIPSTSAFSPAQRALHTSYADLETRRAKDRYESYLDEKETSSLPNAFDLGWRKNLIHVFGPSPWLWWLPICNTTGDGWKWEVSSRWVEAQEEVARNKERRIREAERDQDQNQNQNQNQDVRPHMRGGGGAAYNDDSDGDQHSGNGDIHRREFPRQHYSQSAMSMQTLQAAESISGYGMRKGRNRRDFDEAGEGDDEPGGFEVSGSSDNEDDSDEDGGDDDRGGGGVAGSSGAKARGWRQEW